MQDEQRPLHLAAQFRKLGDRFEKQSSGSASPQHLTTDLIECGVQAGRLMVAAIDAGLFSKVRREENRGWWDRGIARIPGGPLTVYGTIPTWLLTSATMTHPTSGEKVTFQCDPAPDAVERACRDAQAQFTVEQFRRCWINTVTWLSEKFPERFRDRASVRDWWTAATDQEGRILGRDGKPLTGHWYHDGKRLPDGFQVTQGDRRNLQWRLDAEIAGATDHFTDTDLLQHQRIRLEVYSDASDLLAELIVAAPSTARPDAAAATEGEPAGAWPPGTWRNASWYRRATKNLLLPGQLRMAGSREKVKRHRLQESDDWYYEVASVIERWPEHRAIIEAALAAEGGARKRT